MHRPILVFAAVAIALVAIFALAAAAPTRGGRAVLDARKAGGPAMSGENGLLTTIPSRLVAFQFVSL